MKPVVWNIKENRPPYSSDNPNDIVALCIAPIELSDDEIDRVVDETYGVPRNPGIYASHRRLARAILKKASEK